MASEHRHRSGKIKRMHSITEGTLPVLEQIAALDEVSAVIPGRIAQATGGTPRVTFQYFTESGMKLLARTLTAVQEVFVVCVDAEGPKEAKRKLETTGLITEDRTAADRSPGTRASPSDGPPSSKPSSAEKSSAEKSSGGRTSAGPPSEGRGRQGGSKGSPARPEATRQGRPKRRRKPASKLRTWHDPEDESISHVGPRVDDETRRALRRLKRRLK